MASVKGVDGAFQCVDYILSNYDCEYKWVSHEITSIDDLKFTLNKTIEPNTIKKFIYYCLNKYYVNGTSKKSIELKIKEIIKRYYNV